MEFLEKVLHNHIVAVDGKGVLGEVVGPDADEVDCPGDFINQLHSGRHLYHRTDSGFFNVV